MAPPKRNRASGVGPMKEILWALKKADGEMFTRSDIQYDVMLDIFNDQTFEFTSPIDRRPLCFRDLYIETLMTCSKAAKTTIRQLEENPRWALNFSIATFLINIGKINTTVAFYPELRAYMRTYHPIPCLQQDDFSRNNLQDAPRIKTMLKSCSLPYEPNGEAGSLVDIVKRSAAGYRPPTTIVALIFEIFNLEPYITSVHFPDGFSLHDLFSPTGIPTKLRAYAFLFLVHHYLEDPTAEQDFQPNAEVKPFELVRGSPDFNVDSEDEIAWGKEMQTFRLDFLKKWKGEEAVDEIDSQTGTPLTKRQKAIAQNYAQAVEAESGGFNVPESTPKVETSNVECAFATKMSTQQSIQYMRDSMRALDQLGPHPHFSPFDAAVKRACESLEDGHDSYDSESDETASRTTVELKPRLLGFKFPRQSGSNTVIRYGLPTSPVVPLPDFVPPVLPLYEPPQVASEVIQTRDGPLQLSEIRLPTYIT